jgi:hypothetical protein
MDLRSIFKSLSDTFWLCIDIEYVLDTSTIPFMKYMGFKVIDMLTFCVLTLPFFSCAEMWLSTRRNFPLASQEASGALEAYHVKLKTKLFDDSHLGALQRVDWLVHKLTTELHSSYWLDRFADESDSFQNVKEGYITSTSWHRAFQIPDSAVILDNKDSLFAKVASQKDSSVTRIVWNPGSEFSFCDQPSMSFRSFEEVLMDLWRKPVDDSFELDVSSAWTHQMLDQIQKLVELNNSTDIGTVINNMPLKWVSKKGRTYNGKRSSILATPVNRNTKSVVMHKKNRKRKRLSRLI